MMQDNDTVIKTVVNVIDASTVGVTLATVSQILPPIAAFLSIIWLLIRIGDWAYVRFFKK